jgi:hypothetical protein
MGMEKFEPRIESQDLSQEVLKQASFYYQEGKISNGIDLEKAELLIQEIDQTLESEKYFKEDVSLDKILEAIDSLEQEEVMVNFIREKIEDIKEASHRYKDIIERTERSSKTDKFRMNPLDYQKKQEDYDQDRRNCHENIINSLCIIKRNLLKILPQEIVSELFFPFSEEEMRDEKRDDIGDWARINATREELKNYREKLALTLEE